MPSGSDGPFSTRGVGMDAKHASFASGPADHAMHLICKPIHASTHAHLSYPRARTHARPRISWSRVSRECFLTSACQRSPPSDALHIASHPSHRSLRCSSCRLAARSSLTALRKHLP